MQSLEPVPEELRDSVVRFHERSATPPIPQPYRDQLQRVVAGSEFIASALIQDPQALGWFLGRESGAAGDGLRVARSGGTHGRSGAISAA